MRWSQREAWCQPANQDRKSTRLNSSHLGISYAVFCLKKKRQLSRQTFATHRAGIAFGRRSPGRGQVVFHRRNGLPSPRLLFFFNDTATTEIYTLSLHDALPISTTPTSAKTFIRSRRWLRAAV